MYVLVVNHREEPVGKKGFFLVPFPFGFCFTWTHFNEHKTFVGFVVNFMLTLEEKFFFSFLFLFLTITLGNISSPFQFVVLSSTLTAQKMLQIE